MVSNNSNTTTYSGGIGFPGLLTIVFITLKLMGYIAWSWWWVLSPLWINFGLVIITITIVIAIASVTNKRLIKR